VAYGRRFTEFQLNGIAYAVPYSHTAGRWR